MILDTLLTANLWNAILANKVHLLRSSNLGLSKIAYSVSVDSLYKRMMKVSDNFLAEQLLILASSTFSVTLSSLKIINFMLDNQDG